MALLDHPMGSRALGELVVAPVLSAIAVSRLVAPSRGSPSRWRACHGERLGGLVTPRLDGMVLMLRGRLIQVLPTRDMLDIDRLLLGGVEVGAAASALYANASSLRARCAGERVTMLPSQD